MRWVIIALAFLSAPATSGWGQQEHEGYKFVRAAGLEKTTCVIENYDPATTVQTMAWAGLDNNYKDSSWMWLQAGWIDYPALYASLRMYYEYTDENGFYSGIQVRDPPTGAATYGARLSGSDYQLIFGGDAVSVSKSDFDAEPLCAAQFGAELYGSNDQTPGSLSNPCDFSSAVIRLVGGSDINAPFTSCSLAGTGGNWQLDGWRPNGRKSTSVDGSFITWDIRYP